MSKRDSAYSITKGILEGIGGNPNLPYDSTYKVVREIYTHLVGDSTTDFDSTYAIVLAILDGIESGSISPGTPVSGTLAITENGEYNVAIYATASVNVPTGPAPSGTLAITENGEYEVAGLASASVNVPAGINPTGTIAFHQNGLYNVRTFASASIDVHEYVTDYSQVPLTVKCVQAGTLVPVSALEPYRIRYKRPQDSTWGYFNTDYPITLSLEVGDVVSFGAEWHGAGKGDEYNDILFGGTALVDVFGNIDSLIDYTDFTHAQTNYPYSGQFTFKNLFRGNSQIRNCYDLVLPCLDTSANNQKSTYGGMFRESSITVAPKEILATTLGYESCLEMFYGCTNLTQGTKVWATNINGNYCMAHMYRGCVNLVSVPGFQNFTTLSSEGAAGIFENMFRDCTHLVVPPAIPIDVTDPGFNLMNMFAETFKGCIRLKQAPVIGVKGRLTSQTCREMFSGCTALKYVPELYFVSSDYDGCKEMFKDCTSLEQITLGLADLDNCQNMFYGCSNLKRVSARNLAGGSASDWLHGVSGSGTIVVNTGVTTSTLPSGSDSGVPIGWTVVAEQPFTIPAA